MEKPYEKMTLEELTAEQQALIAQRKDAIEQLRAMTPYLDAAWEADTAAKAALADPTLTQGISVVDGAPVDPELNRQIRAAVQSVVKNYRGESNG